MSCLALLTGAAVAKKVAKPSILAKAAVVFILLVGLRDVVTVIATE